MVALVEDGIANSCERSLALKVASELKVKQMVNR
jgi:hypothetical protein